MAQNAQAAQSYDINALEQRRPQLRLQVALMEHKQSRCPSSSFTSRQSLCHVNFSSTKASVFALCERNWREPEREREREREKLHKLALYTLSSKIAREDEEGEGALVERQRFILVRQILPA